jgi:NAD(P)H-hydrate epimerase
MNTGKGLSVSQAKDLDRRAQEELGIDVLVLMENAGRAVAEVATKMLGHKKRIAVFCGKGNNGGDGFVCARHLLVNKKLVDIYLVGKISQLKGPALANLNISLNLGKKIHEIPDLWSWQKTKQKIKDYDLIIDGLLGIGLRGDVEEPLSTIIKDLNNSKVAIISIDTPSGLDADTGKPCGVSIKAAKTVTFVASKKGFLKKEAKIYTGRVIVKDLGF